jgi:hypothetical protein
VPLDPAEQPGAEIHELVLPFVVCRSVGGPFDDDAFVAGFQAGQVDQALHAAKVARATEVRFTVNSTLVKQLDLIAMNRGFPVVDAVPSEEAPEWVFMTFRTEPADPGS